MTNYILHVSLLLGLGFILYQILLRKETFYSLNRMILSSYILLAFTLPLIHIPQDWSLKNMAPIVSAENTSSAEAKEGRTLVFTPPTESKAHAETNEIQKDNHKENHNEASKVVSATEIAAQNADTTTPGLKETIQKTSSSINWIVAIKWIYLIGLGIFLINFLVQFFILLYYRFKYPTLKDGPMTIVEMEGDKAPFSFLNMIYINPSKYDYNTYEQILAHEKIHITRWHSIDIFLSELALTVLWFNPFAWLYRKAVEHNLEYLTDQEMLASGANAEVYQMNLLKVSVPDIPLSLSTNYNQSFLKKRIHMMNAKKSSARSTWKYLFILPILGLSVALFNPTFINAQTTEPLEQEEVSHISIPAQDVDEQNEQQTEVEQEEENSNSLITQGAVQPLGTNVQQIQSNTPIEEINMLDIPEDAELQVSKTEDGYSIISNDGQKISIDRNRNKTVVINSKETLENTGVWEAELDGNRVCLFIKKGGLGKDYYWTSSECFKTTDFNPAIRPNAEGEFSLTRDPGTLVLKGEFSSNDGVGRYTFTPNTDFITTAKNEGYTIRERKLIHFFLSGFDKSFFGFLKSNGYTNIDDDELLGLAIHDVNEEYIKDINGEFRKANYDMPDVDELIAMKIHNVDKEYIQGFGQAMVKNMEVDDIISAAIHNVDPKYISEFKAMGFDDLDFDDLISTAIHNVDTDYVKELKSAGFEDMDFDDLISASIHNVNPDYIKKFKNAGFEDLDFDDMISASIHNVDPDYIQAFKKAGLELDFDDLVSASIHNVDIDYMEKFQNAGIEDFDFDDMISAAIHNVDPNFVKEAKTYGFELDMDDLVTASIHNVDLKQLKAFSDAGMEDVDFDDMVTASIHNVNPDFIREFSALGYDGLEFDDLVSASIHGVSIDFIRGFKEAGFTDLDFDDFITASIHGIQPKYIKKIKNAGLSDIDFDDIVSFGIHGVDTDDIKAFKDMGFDLEADELITAQIHGVTPKFIRKMQDKGHKGLDFDEYVKLKIHGF